MSLKKNILASYASQTYATLIGIVMTPVYIYYMGIEAYGLIGFYAMLQAIFQILDVGLTPTMARETARFNGGAIDATTLRRLLRALEWIFIGIALLGCITMISGSGFIANHWLNVQNLPIDEVQKSIILIAMIVVLRWICGLYRSSISGFERLVWLSGFNFAISTTRFVLIIPILVQIESSLKVFFLYQLAIAIFELIFLTIKTYSLLPASNEDQLKFWTWASLHSALKFSFVIALTSGAWIFATQIDKIILSSLLSLTDYGHFTLAVLAASGVLMVSNPISLALLPRMTRLQAEGDEAGLLRIYKNATQLVAVITIPAGLILFTYSEKILWIWSGNADIAHQAAPILRLYALGNVVLAFTAFPYYLQFAKGDLKLHFIGSFIFISWLIPSLTIASLNYGGIGAGYAWVVANFLYFSLWTPFIHKRIFGKFHRAWLLKDILLIFIIGIAAIAITSQISFQSKSKFESTLHIISIGIFTFIACLLGSSFSRMQIKKYTNIFIK